MLILLLCLLLLALLGSYWGYRRYGTHGGLAVGIVTLAVILAAAFFLRALPQRPESSPTAAPPAAPRGTTR